MTQNPPDAAVPDKLAAAYWPLHRSVLAIIGVYYTYVTFAHFVDERGSALAILASLSALTAIIGFGLLYARLKGYVQSRNAVDFGMLVAGLMMLVNVFVYHLIHYDPPKLVYFPLVAMAGATTSLSLRGTAVSVGLNLIGLFTIVGMNAPELVPTYASIAVATLATSFGMATLLRAVVGREVLARDAADRAALAAIDANTKSQRLQRLDALTALPNRSGLFELLEAVLAKPGSSTGYVFGVMDLDRFKSVNDLFGQSAGDRVLRETAARLSVAGGYPATVARLGGDQFAVLVEARLAPDDLEDYARDLAHSLAEPFRVGATAISVSGSFGFTYLRAGDTVELLLDRADYAAHDAKRHARGGFVLFGQSHEESILIERELERSMLSGSMEREIEATFQPIVDGASHQVVGYEALARWTHPQLGTVAPSLFIPVAERLGYLPRITQVMVQQSLSIAASLPAGLRVSVNLSAHDLNSEDAIRRIAAILAESPQRPCRLDFEVTETAIMPDLGEAIERLLVLCANGCRIALDDFGTGHSSLTRVQRLPLDRIKIDRCFTALVEGDSTSAAIIKTTLDLCRNLEMECVIEGVETAAQLEALRALGARYFQGYYFGHPLSRAELLTQLGQRLIA